MSTKTPSVADYFNLNGDPFKCRQKKNLTGFISRVLELAQGEPSNIHPDFRA